MCKVRRVGAVVAFCGQEEYLLLDNYFARKRTNIECRKAKGSITLHHA
jgi:hypothetical protein